MAKRRGKPIDYKAAGNWYAAAFGLQSWTIALDLAEDPPAWAEDIGDRPMGAASIVPAYEQAQVWVSEKRSVEQNIDPLSTFFHELGHVSADKAGIENDGDGRREYFLNRFGDLCAAAYRAGVKVG